MQLDVMIGKPIVSLDAGEKGGTIEDVLLDGSRRHVVGVLVAGGMLSKQRILPLTDVHTAGVDVVIVRTLGTMRDAKDWLREGQPTHRWTEIRGKAVVTADGGRVGTLRDLIADPATGDIESLEIASTERSGR
jgi:sporulation protein YlmC with PRC-barrel domain